MHRRFTARGALASAAVLAAALLGTGTVSAEEPTARPDRLDHADVEAVRDRLDPIAPAEGAAAAAPDDTTVSPMFIPDGVCSASEYGDPDEPGDALLDVVSYALSYDCMSSTWILGVDTTAGFADEDLAWLDMGIDTNNNLTDGCAGSDYVALLTYDDGYIGGLFRTTSCNVDLWNVVPGSAGMRYVRPAPNQIGLTFNGSTFTHLRTFAWDASITHWDINDPVDWMPDVGRQVTGANPCGGRCFFLTNGTTGGPADVQFRDPEPAHQIFIGDWNADGGDSLGFRHDNTYRLKNALAATSPDITFAYGRSSDRPMVGDWDGNGTDTVALRRGNYYYMKNSFGGGAADIVVAYGRPDDVVLVGDWDGNGTDTLAVRRGSYYYIKNSFTGGPADAVVAYGRSGDVVLIGDWDGDGDDTIGVRRGSTYFLKNTISGGTADTTFSYGRPTDITFVGDWDANGTDTLGVRR